MGVKQDVPAIVGFLRGLGWVLEALALIGLIAGLIMWTDAIDAARTYPANASFREIVLIGIGSHAAAIMAAGLSAAVSGAVLFALGQIVESLVHLQNLWPDSGKAPSETTKITGVQAYAARQTRF